MHIPACGSAHNEPDGSVASQGGNAYATLNTCIQCLSGYLRASQQEQRIDSLKRDPVRAVG